jgi:hypothetical protein
MNLRGVGARQTEMQSRLRLPWPRDAAHNADAAMERLFGIFPDHHPKLLAEDEVAWIFGLGWPAHLLENTDPTLSVAAHRGYGLELRALAGYLEVRRCAQADFVFSMFHSRALLAPSLAFARLGRPPRCIVHVDAHSDLLPPLLSATGPAILGNDNFSLSCHLEDPATVSQAIDDGLIHKGSFLAAYLLATPGAELFHVWEEITPRRRSFVQTIAEVTIGATKIKHGKLVEAEATVANPWIYNEVTALPASLSSHAEKGVWLDVDMDAFCNRFDGDSDRRELRGSPEESHEVRRRIALFLDQLRSAPWRRSIEAISVAASPGFFPAEYWDTAIPAICDGIAAAIVHT